MSLRKKILLTFFLTIAIVGAVVAVCASSIRQISSASKDLARAHLPQINLSNNLERNVSESRLEINRFLDTGDSESLLRGEAALGLALQALEKADRHSQSFSVLESLRKSISLAKQAAEEFRGNVEKAEAAVKNLAGIQSAMEEAAVVFSENCLAYLAVQNKLIAAEIGSELSKEQVLERLNRIQLATRISRLGGEIRAANFKAQLTREYSELEKLLQSLDKVLGLLSAIRNLTTDDEGIKQVETIRSGAENYKKNLSQLLHQRKGLNEVMQALRQSSQNISNQAKETAESEITQASVTAESDSITLQKSLRQLIWSVVAALILGMVVFSFITARLIGDLLNIAKQMRDGSEKVSGSAEQILSHCLPGPGGDLLLKVQRQTNLRRS